VEEVRWGECTSSSSSLQSVRTAAKSSRPTASSIEERIVIGEYLQVVKNVF